MAGSVTHDQRKTIATVYARKSAKQRQALRRDAERRVFEQWVSEFKPNPEAWPFTHEVVGHHPLGGELRVGYAGRSVVVPFGFLGVAKSYLIPYTCIHEIITAVYKLVGFDRGRSTLWQFEIQYRADHSAQFAVLRDLIVSSIADVHITADGTIFRAYTLDNEVLVEYQLKEDQGYVTVSGIEYFLKLKGVGVQDAA